MSDRYRLSGELPAHPRPPEETPKMEKRLEGLDPPEVPELAPRDRQLPPEAPGVNLRTPRLPEVPELGPRDRQLPPEAPGVAVRPPGSPEAPEVGRGVPQPPEAPLPLDSRTLTPPTVGFQLPPTETREPLIFPDRLTRRDRPTTLETYWWN